MRVLICNDDGVHAHGLHALVREMRQIAEVTVLVPDRPRSACGHAVTLHKPLRVEEVLLEGGGKALICNGTPSDCVALGVEVIMPKRPDLVIAGINLGPNLGDDVSYSGTVSAAMEGAIFGVRSFAISVCGYENIDFTYTASLSRRIAERIMRAGLPVETLLNVNVPAVPAVEIAGIEFTHLGRRRWTGQFHERDDMRGGTYYWRAGEPQDDPSQPGTDVWAINNQRVSITPVQLQWTDVGALGRLSEILAGLL